MTAGVVAAVVVESEKIMRTLKILGFLLTYPTEQFLGALGECYELLYKEKWLSESLLEEFRCWTQELSQTSSLDLQEDYVSLFDRTPSLSLHLFEHVHGDSRERGQALVDLSNLYEESGLVIDVEETPDYLPLFLEYLSSCSLQDVQDNLGNIVNIVTALEKRLQKRESSYALIFKALAEIAVRKPDSKEVKRALKNASGEAYDFEKLDQEWEEQFAFDTLNNSTASQAGCPKAEDMLARMDSYKDKKRDINYGS